MQQVTTPDAFTFPEEIHKGTLYFSGCWLFLNKSNNESLVTNMTPPIEVYPPTNVRKNFDPTKFWQIFKLSLYIIMWRGQKLCYPQKGFLIFSVGTIGLK